MENKNKSIRKTFVAKALLILLTLAMIGGVLASCSTGTTKTTLTSTEISASTGHDNCLSADQLNEIRKKIVDSSSATKIREALVAAINGYNMVADGFDDEKLPEANPAEAVTYAKAVLIKYEISISVYSNDLTEEDLALLVKSFQTTAETETTMGLLDRIMYWIAKGFEWIINVLGFGSFILGTFIFAVVVEIILIPIAILQQNNSRKSAKLRPKEMAIRNKYKGRNDQVTNQKIQQEIQELYQKEGYNPMTSGCLPLLISIPFVFALYYIVIDPLKYMMACPSDISTALQTFATTSKAAGGLGLDLSSNRGTIELLSLIREQSNGGTEVGAYLSGLQNFAYYSNASEIYDTLVGILNNNIPNFSVGSLNLGLTPSFSRPDLLLGIPVLTFGVYFASMKINKKFTYQPTQGNTKDPAQGCSNGIMDVSMPLISAWFTFMVPGAVGLYWAMKSIVSTFKSFIMSKVMPLPKFTEEDYKAAERELAGKDKNKPVKKNGNPNPNVRSLHHIDDDDDEDYSLPAKKASNQPYTEEEEVEPTTVNDSPLSEGVTLKEDKPQGKKAKGKKEEQAEPSVENEMVDAEEPESAKEAEEPNETTEQ